MQQGVSYPSSLPFNNKSVLTRVGPQSFKLSTGSGKAIVTECQIMVL